jgi:hypothetical protein
MKMSLMLLLTCVVCTNALADDLTPNNCKQPTIPSTLASDTVKIYFEKHNKQYKLCMKQFVDDQRALSKSSQDVAVANRAHDSAEAAIKEFNDFTDALNERNVRSGDADPDDDKSK